LEPIDGLAKVRRLIKEGYLNLGERLADDINTELLGWQAQVSHLRKVIPPDPNLLENLDQVAQDAKALRNKMAIR
jgi:hypothetical protein